MNEAERLLKEALDFLNDMPNYHMRYEKHRSTYELAARIDRYFRGQA